MELGISRLTKENKYLIDGFNCVESDESLAEYSAKVRRRIKNHSKDMLNFLQKEAFEDQEKGLSKTYLFTNEEGVLVAYLSLCNDAIRLEFDERDGMDLPYTTIPALKVARLAVSTEYQGQGIGKEALSFAIFVSQKVREYSGVVFLTLDCFEHQVSYYEKFGFEKNLFQLVVKEYDSPISMRLWLDNYLSNIIG